MFLCVAFTTLFSMLLTYTYNWCEQYFPEKTNYLKIQIGWYGLKAYTKVMNTLDKITIFQKNIFYQQSTRVYTKVYRFVLHLLLFCLMFLIFVLVLS